MKKSKKVKPPIDRVQAAYDAGLTSKEVEERVRKGYTNTTEDPNQKTILQILANNLFTFFNIVLFTIAFIFIGFIIYLNAIGRSDIVNAYFGFSKFVFLIPAIMNVAMGSFQEFQSMKTIQKLRIVTSTNHAWNIVKLNGKWYNVDATWDSSTASGREWYLLGSDHFSGGMHTATAEYSALSFQSAHPISAADYVPGSEPEQDSPFYTDVPQGRWSYDSIQAATRLGLMQGTGNGKFDPQMEVSRGMLVTVLWRMEGSPECSSAGFSDVPI